MITDYTLSQMAVECAQFARDNSPIEPEWDHSPLGMWHSIHDREGVSDPGPMPDEFKYGYLTACVRIGGRVLLMEVSR